MRYTSRLRTQPAFEDARAVLTSSVGRILWSDLEIRTHPRGEPVGSHVPIVRRFLASAIYLTGLGVALVDKVVRCFQLWTVERYRFTTGLRDITAVLGSDLWLTDRPWLAARASLANLFAHARRVLI